jgi:enoyl-CoA hydratase/carnithine racemase
VIANEILAILTTEETMPKYESPYDPSTAPKNLEHVLYEKKGHVAYVTINRPEVRNALHTYAYAELRSCWRDIGIDPNIYCAIVTGAGEAFCAGRDVKFLAQHQAQGKRTPHEDPTHPMFQWGGGGKPNDANLEKPLIAAINGFAVGVGLTIALQCQLRVMADDAWLGDTHTKVGRLGDPHEIYEMLPRADAAYLTLCNGRLTAQECLQKSIVNTVVPKEKLIEAAEQLAEMICDSSPLAVQAAVRLYRLTAAFPASLTAYARQLDKETAESEDGAEGPRAFREKRKPVWTMR